MKRPLLVLCAAACVAAAASIGFSGAATVTKPVSVKLPPSNAVFKDGPNVGLARGNCLTCHSSDYVYTQPPLSQRQWTAEVNKMIHVYGAPVAASDVDAIVTYLMSQNGRATP